MNSEKSESHELPKIMRSSTQNKAEKDKDSLNSFSQELDEISLFIQRFADAHVIDQIRIIKDTDSTIKSKMDTLDWLARYSEFVSTDSISNCLKEFKELYSNDDSKIKSEYIDSRNNSVAIVNIIQQIDHTAKLFCNLSG